MNRPSYANAFAVSYNPQAHEIVINFVQEYPVIDPEGIGQEPQKEREHVSSITLPDTIANQLQVALNNMINPEIGK